jgi:hypothetical protein
MNPCLHYLFFTIINFNIKYIIQEVQNLTVRLGSPYEQNYLELLLTHLSEINSFQLHLKQQN